MDILVWGLFKSRKSPPGTWWHFGVCSFPSGATGLTEIPKSSGPSLLQQKDHERKSSSSWWFQPLWKILVKLDHFPKIGWKKKMKPPTSHSSTGTYDNNWNKEPVPEKNGCSILTLLPISLMPSLFSRPKWPSISWTFADKITIRTTPGNHDILAVGGRLGLFDSTLSHPLDSEELPQRTWHRSLCWQ